jgi:hypothetical protein
MLCSIAPLTLDHRGVQGQCRHPLAGDPGRGNLNSVRRTIGRNSRLAAAVHSATLAAMVTAELKLANDQHSAGFKYCWVPLVNKDKSVQAKVENLLNP